MYLYHDKDQARAIDQELEKIITNKLIDGDRIIRKDCIVELRMVLSSSYRINDAGPEHWIPFQKIYRRVKARQFRFERMWRQIEKQHDADLDFGYKLICEGVCSLSGSEINKQAIKFHLQKIMKKSIFNKIISAILGNRSKLFNKF